MCLLFDKWRKKWICFTCLNQNIVWSSTPGLAALLISVRLCYLKFIYFDITALEFGSNLHFIKIYISCRTFWTNYAFTDFTLNYIWAIFDRCDDHQFLICVLIISLIMSIFIFIIIFRFLKLSRVKSTSIISCKYFPLSRFWSLISLFLNH